MTIKTIVNAVEGRCGMMSCNVSKICCVYTKYMECCGQRCMKGKVWREWCGKELGANYEERRLLSRKYR